MTQRDVAIGYLVTGDSVPVAFVHRLGLASLRLAGRIRNGAEPVAPAIDLRASFPTVIARYLLRPVRDDGHAVTNADFPAAMFTVELFECGEKLELKRFTAAGFRDFKRRTELRLNEKSGTSAQPNTPTPASNEGEKVAKLTAA